MNIIFILMSILNPDVLQTIVSKQLLKYSTRSCETDFEKFISNGINIFIKTNTDIKERLSSFIKDNMIQLNAIDIITKIIMNKSLHNSQTQDLIKVYSYFARKTLISVLFDPPSYFKRDTSKSFLHNLSTLNLFQNMLMNNSYFGFPKDMVIRTVKTMFDYIRNTIESLRISKFHTYVTGHFIEAILTETKYYSTWDSLRRCMCVDKQNNKWLYTENDFDSYSQRIEYLISKINWRNFKGNCFLYSTFPYVYIDYVVKSGHTEEEFQIRFNELIKLFSTKINNFKLFRNSLKGYICSVLLISSETYNTEEIKFKELKKYKRIRFKGSVINNTPLTFENDMITASELIEIKTGNTDTKKNMSKLILENIIFANNTNIFKNLIIFNPRSNIVSFISAKCFRC